MSTELSSRPKSMSVDNTTTVESASQVDQLLQEINALKSQLSQIQLHQTTPQKPRERIRKPKSLKQNALFQRRKEWQAKVENLDDDEGPILSFHVPSSITNPRYKCYWCLREVKNRVQFHWHTRRGIKKICTKCRSYLLAKRRKEEARKPVVKVVEQVVEKVVEVEKAPVKPVAKSAPKPVEATKTTKKALSANVAPFVPKALSPDVAPFVPKQQKGQTQPVADLMQTSFVAVPSPAGDGKHVLVPIMNPMAPAFGFMPPFMPMIPPTQPAVTKPATAEDRAKIHAKWKHIVKNRRSDNDNTSSDK